MSKMRVAQIARAGGLFEVLEHEIPEPGVGQVLVKVEACGICHSDVLIKEGMWPGIQYPRVPGHEHYLPMCGRYRRTTKEEELARIYLDLPYPDCVAKGSSDQLEYRTQPRRGGNPVQSENRPTITRRDALGAYSLQGQG
jgi:hypothetical protein